MIPQTKHATLLIQGNKGLHTLPTQQLQDAIDYIIHYNPEIVMVDNTITDATLMAMKRSVHPWFSGKIMRHGEQ